MDWILSQIQTLATLGFCAGVVAIAVLVLLAWRYQTPWALRYAGALAVVVVFFFLFTAFVGTLRFFAFWIAAAVLWGSFIGAVLAAGLGLVRRSARALLVSAILSLPFSFYLFLSPGTRAAVIVPVILLAIFWVMRWFERRGQGSALTIYSKK